MVHPASDEAWVKDSEPAIVSGSRQNDASSPSGYKVGFPPKRKLVTQFTDRLKETFLGDDPLRPYKDQPRSRKFVLGLQYLFPIFDWGRNYNFKKFKGDAISGLTIASLCIPQVNLVHCFRLFYV